MKTLQKTTWMRYIRIGISMMVVNIFLNCKGQVDNYSRSEYIYINKISDSLYFEVYDRFKNTNYKSLIKISDSLIFNMSGDPGTYPFTDIERNSRTGDSVIIRFKSNKCVTYVRNERYDLAREGVFWHRNYDNFNTALVINNLKRYRYTIDSTDYKKAVVCR